METSTILPGKILKYRGSEVSLLTTKRKRICLSISSPLRPQAVSGICVWVGRLVASIITPVFVGCLSVGLVRYCLKNVWCSCSSPNSVRNSLILWLVRLTVLCSRRV